MKKLLTYLIILIVGIGCSDYYNTKNLSGIYYTDENKEYSIKLNADNTFLLDSIPNISFYGKGKWKSNGIDGQIEFYNDKGNLLDWAMPSQKNTCPQITFNLYGKTEMKFKKLNCQ